MKTNKSSAIVLLFLSFASPVVAEVSYIPGSGWKTFSFHDPISNPYKLEGRFTFRVYSGQNAVLTVTDSAWNGERYEIYNNGGYMGWTTSDPTSSGNQWTSSYDSAESAQYWSHGSSPLAPGLYNLSFRLLQWNTDKPDAPMGNTYSAAFKVTVIQAPDADGDSIADQFETNTGIHRSPVDTGTNPAKSDTDGDGLSDWAEISTYFTDPNKADTDGDGFRDLAEITAGKSPTNANDNPDAAMETRTAVEVTLYSKEGTNYQVEWSEDLIVWTPLPEVIIGDGNPVTRFYSTRAHPRRYFRAVKMTP